MESAWAVNGALARRWRWNQFRRNGAGYSREFCKRATPSATCSPRWRFGPFFPPWGWRAMFFIGGLPALLTLFIRSRVKESEPWRANAVAKSDWRAYFRAVAANWKRFLYLVILMAAMNFISHGTQDLYPSFLQHQLKFGTSVTAMITAISMVGAIVGGILVGLYSDRSGRRRAMIAAMMLGIVFIPLWVFAPR